MDVNMPKMDGFEACRRIKADPALAGIFIIIMSSTSTDSDSRADGLNMGADGYIARPIANRELLARVEAMLRIKAAEQTLKKYSEALEQMVAERTRELREAQEQLVRKEKLAVLGQMAGSVGHELRNPLAVIKGAVYYLKLVQPDADDKVKEYLDRIESETHNADKIISDLLDFSRIKSVDMEPVAVSDLVLRALERFPAPENVRVTLNLPENLPKIYVDLRQMIQVLGNLVVNACQAMISTPLRGQASSTTALVETKLTISAALEGDTMKIVVQDTGVGISSENMNKLFEPLFTTKAKGIGLGLAVSKKLTEANGGRIEVESEPDKGSTFTLWLPCYSLPN
jgi:signal transduction histidine kinase